MDAGFQTAEHARDAQGGGSNDPSRIPSREKRRSALTLPERYIYNKSECVEPRALLRLRLTLGREIGCVGRNCHMARRRSMSLLVTGWKVLDRCVSVVFWLGMICLVLLGMSFARRLIFGSSSSFRSLGFGGLWIDYEVRSGGVLPERLAHVVISEISPIGSGGGGSTNACTLLFGDPNSITTGQECGETSWTDSQGHVVRLGPGVRLEDMATPENSVTFRPERRETIWIDEQHHVTSLGRALSLEDMETLGNARSDEGPTISSPEEFLATVARLRAKSAQRP